ncbi:hypothetical protein F3J38_25650 [Pantoea sp. Acro-805]|uniref:Transposase n=1 Tax=Candidatus Pantoea formicae TaxID=2608355 RepID=A0ABX0R2D2_9GAMM|nr:hypothetical protein [Pantoea formicae]NIF03392.1 hypothetical protein [Pantoea formicae]
MHLMIVHLACKSPRFVCGLSDKAGIWPTNLKNFPLQIEEISCFAGLQKSVKNPFQRHANRLRKKSGLTLPSPDKTVYTVGLRPLAGA